ncbi:MAG: XdhC/CoxI family protein [Chitinophagaceae bacterium]|nr:MAG: XdhC/CoxI family protein [Chitinophagaceae bacterium]
MTWQFAIDKLTARHRVFLLLVLDSKGSSPGRQGFKMMVSSDGTMEGSIGGGIMEHKFVELVRSRMSAEPGSPEIHLQVHDKNSSSRSGMICSGEQTLYMTELFCSDVVELEKIASSVKKNKDHAIEISDTGVKLREQEHSEDYFFQRCGEEAFIYRERVGKKNTLHIIGGGHCSLALSKLMSEMDFVVNVYDDRPELNTMQQNSFADNLITLSSYSQLPEWIRPGNNVYVIIMSFGYRTDDQALRAILHIPVKYLGMIGSKKKVEQMFEAYKQEGMDEALLQEVHAPAGLFIKSETPEEIAVSIAGEIIRVKNTGQ